MTEKDWGPCSEAKSWIRSRLRSISRKWIGVLLAAATLMGPDSVMAQVQSTIQGQWQALMDDFSVTLHEEGVVGAGGILMHHGTILGQEHFGFADLESERTVDENTIFHWGSITKTLTGISIMQLRDRGRLSLNDPIVKYVPELMKVHNPFGDMEEITIRHLLSHSAGFRGSTWPWGGGEEWHPHEPTTWEQIVAMLPYTRINFLPGSRFSYSNPAIIFLARVVERLSGDDWEVYVDKNILKPLGMYSTYFDQTPYHLLERRSNNYYIHDGLPVANGLDFDTGITVSNGGLNSPLTDMALYMDFLLGIPRHTAAFEAVLARESLEEMWVEEVSIGIDGQMSRSMGLSFFIVNQGDERFLGHTGSQKAFFSFFYIHPSTQSAVVFVMNTAGQSQDSDPRPNPRALLSLLTERVFEEIFSPAAQGRSQTQR